MATPVVENEYSGEGKKVASITMSSVVVPSGTGRAIYVVAAGVTKNSEDGKFVSGVTFNTSETFSFLGEAQNAQATAQIWYLLNPTETTADIVVTFDDNNATWEGAGVGAQVLSGVDTVGTPHDTWDTPSEGSSTAPTHTINTATGNYCLDIVGFDDTGSSGTLTENGVGDIIWVYTAGGKGDAASSDFVATGATAAMAYSFSGVADSWVHAGVSVYGVAGVTTYDYTRLSDSAIKQPGYADKSQLSDVRIQTLGTDYTRLSDARILFATDHTLLSDTAIQASTDYSRQSDTIIKVEAYADIQLLSDVLIVNSHIVDQLSDVRIKTEGTDYTLLSNSTVKRLGYADKSQLSDSRIKREAIQDYTRLSDVRIKLEPSDDYTRPSDTTISLITDYTRPSDARILNSTDYTLLSTTQIAGGSTVDLLSTTAIYVGGFADKSQLSDTRIQVLANETTQLSDIRILQTTDLTLLSDIRIKTADEITQLSDTRVQVLVQEDTKLSDVRIKTSTDYTRTSDTTITVGAATYQIDMDSVTAIKVGAFADYTRTSDTAISLPSFTIDHLSDVAILKTQELSPLSDVAILKTVDYTRSSDTTIIFGSTIDIDSDVRIKREAIDDKTQSSDVRIQTLGTDLTTLSNSSIKSVDQETAQTSLTRVRSEMPQIQEFSFTRVKVLAEQIDLTSDTKIILRYEITALSETRLKGVQELSLLSVTKISTSLTGLKVELTSGTYIRLADLNLTDIKAKFVKIHGIKANTRRVNID